MTDRSGDVLIWVDEVAPPRARLTWSVYPWQNATRTRRKAEMLTRLYASGAHACQRCGSLIEPQKRVDAVYCSERCRKHDARERRKARENKGVHLK